MNFPVSDGGKERSIKGFLYFQDGNWLLSQQPNLKTCCLDSLNPQSLVVLEGNFDSIPSYKTIEVRGTLIIDQSQHWPYHLKNAALVDKPSPSCLQWLWLLIVPFGLIWIANRLKRLSK